MDITVKGGTKKQRELSLSMAYYCANMLMPRMQSLNVEIFLKKFTAEDPEVNETDHGYAIPTEDEAYPRFFEIEVNKNVKLRRVLETVAHEMVHVKQFARGELYESTRLGKHRWNGKWLKKNPDYWDQPWEIEAHGREIGLFIRWAEKEGYSKLKWVKDA
jgi:hypothetical protein